VCVCVCVQFVSMCTHVMCTRVYVRSWRVHVCSLYVVCENSVYVCNACVLELMQCVSSLCIQNGQTDMTHVVTLAWQLVHQASLDCGLL